MADDNISQGVKNDRVEIDTSLPFQSVKAAVSLFGDNTKKFKLPEKHGVKDSELQHLKDELHSLKVQLKSAEYAKEKAMLELQNSKRLLDEIAKGFGEQFPPTKHIDAVNAPPHSNGMKQASPNTVEKHVVWEVQLKVAQEQHMTAVAELESAKREMQKLQQELAMAVSEKENALRQAEEALLMAEVNARRVDELSREISGTNESLMLVKLACIEASKERAALLAAKGAVTNGTPPPTTLPLPQDTAAIKELEAKLVAATEELNSLRNELVLAKQAEGKMSKAAAEALADLERVKAELEKMQSLANNSSDVLSSDLDMAKVELEKAVQKGVSLQATMTSLQNELENMKKELAQVREREANASAAVVTLTTELTRTKAELKVALAAEAKANEAISGLSQTLEQIRTEAEEAKTTANSLKEEASKARADAEQAKVAASTAETDLEVALKTAEAAKAAESEAISKFKQLSEKASVARTSTEAQTTTTITISQEEYNTLKKKVQEAEDLATMKVAAANAQVEAVKMSEMHLNQRLETLNDDIDTIKNNTKQALQRAEMAEAAKHAIESEMKRLREKELNEKKEDQRVVTLVQKDMLRMESKSQHLLGSLDSQKDYFKFENKSQHLSFSRDKPPESLAQILNMRMPPLEKENGDLQHHVQIKKKKKPTFFGTILGKKSQPTSVNKLVLTS